MLDLRETTVTKQLVVPKLLRWFHFSWHHAWLSVINDHVTNLHCSYNIHLLKHLYKIWLHSSKKMTAGKQTWIPDFRLILCEEAKWPTSCILTVYINIFLHAIWINYIFLGSAPKSSARCTREKWAHLSLPNAEAIIHCIYSTAFSFVLCCSVLHDLLLVHNVCASQQEALF